MTGFYETQHQNEMGWNEQVSSIQIVLKVKLNFRNQLRLLPQIKSTISVSLGIILYWYTNFLNLF